MRRYLFPFILVASVLFFWPDRNPIVITRIARVIVCSFILAPCIIAILLFIKPEIAISELWQILKSKVTIKGLKSLLRFIANAANEIKPITWISFFISWLGITATYNILFGFLSFNVASTEMLYFLSLALMFYLVQRLNIESDIIIKTITYIVIFQAALGIFQYTTGIYFPFENVIGKRVAVGFLDHTSNFGTFLAIGLPFVFSFHWLLGLFVLFAIVLSGSLTGLIASVSGIYIFYRSKKLAIAGLILITVFFFFYKTQVLDQHASSVVTRINMWTESLKITAYKPLTGFGLGNYHIIMPQYMQQKPIPQIGNNELWDNPSNDYVRAVFEAGFPVLIFIAGFIYTTIRRYNRLLCAFGINRNMLHSRTSDNDIKLCFSSFVTILVLCMGYSLFLNPTNIIWAVIIIALLNSELNRREIEC